MPNRSRATSPGMGSVLLLTALMWAVAGITFAQAKRDEPVCNRKQMHPGEICHEEYLSRGRVHRKTFTYEQGKRDQKRDGTLLWPIFTGLGVVVLGAGIWQNRTPRRPARGSPSRPAPPTAADSAYAAHIAAVAEVARRPPPPPPIPPPPPPP